MDVCPCQSHALYPLKESASNPKGRAMLWSDDMGLVFRDLKCMLTSETLLDYPDWKILFTIHTDDSGKQLGAFISQNDKPIDLFSIKSSKSQHNYNMKENEILLVVECINQSRGIIFGYEINAY